MKFILVALLIASIVAVAFAEPEIEDREGRQSCPRVCTGRYQPVCSSNNRCIRAFNNRCELNRTNCNLPPRRRWNVVGAHYCNNFSPPNFTSCRRSTTD